MKISGNLNVLFFFCSTFLSLGIGVSKGSSEVARDGMVDTLGMAM